MSDTVTLWRPAGPEELALVEASGWREWPPRLPGQPIFYPVLSEEYAAKIARDWNVPRSGAGYVTRFQVLRSFLDHYEVRQAGGKTTSASRRAITAYTFRTAPPGRRQRARMSPSLAITSSIRLTCGRRPAPRRCPC